VANKGAQLLDIYATELKYLSSMENRESRVRMKEIISRCSQASSVVSNPRSVAVIKEHAGKVLMTSRRYEEAYNEFFDAFKAYSDTGNLAAKRALNYAVIANMCALSSINPFDSREAKAYEQDSSVAFVKKLRDAYERHRLDEICSLDFSPLLDQVMIGHVSDMIYRLKLSKLATVCPAYKRITFAALGEKVCSDSETTRKMVMRLILEGSIKGLLNEQEVEMSQSEDVGLQEARVLCETAEFIKIKLNGILESHKEA
jgi:COP9 signalosome complex subunit 2